jgi:hypothetical protein
MATILFQIWHKNMYSLTSRNRAQIDQSANRRNDFWDLICELRVNNCMELTVQVADEQPLLGQAVRKAFCSVHLSTDHVLYNPVL